MSVLDSVAIGLASWFGIGFIPFFPNALAVLATWLLVVVFARHLSHRRLLSVLVVVTVLGTWASSVWGGITGLSDDGRIVIDEAAGYLLAIIFARRLDAIGALIMVPLFIGLDVLKPWPIDRVEMLPFGLGVMGDDLAAGLILGLGWALCVVIWRRTRTGDRA